MVREARQIEDRRARNSQRVPRMLHAKTRLFGIDTLSLDAQVNEKQERERLEEERNLYYDDLNTSFARALNEQDAFRAKNRREQMDELTMFRKAQEKEKKRKDVMEKTAGDELNNVPTNFLKFGGEDANNANRARAQKLQQQDWLAQQIESLQAREQREQQEATDYNRMLENIVEVQGQQQQQADAERARARREIVSYNKQMASYKMAKNARALQANQTADDTEISQALNGKFLNEASLGGGSNFKGFSTVQRQRILDEQKAQMDELRAKRALEEEEEREYAQQQEDVRRARLLADRKGAAFKKQQLTNLANDRIKQAKEKTMRYDYLDNVVYTNAADASYFEQFGTSCR